MIPLAALPKDAKKRNVFRILFLCMVAFGALMGLAFPPLEKLYYGHSTPITFSFTIMCLAAGITVGVVNYILFSLVVSKELRFLVQGMHTINRKIQSTSFSKYLPAKPVAL